MLSELGALTDVVSGRRWEPHQLRRQIILRAARYQQNGVRAGDRVLILAENTLEFFAELFAVWRLGCVAIPCDSSLSAFEIDNLIAASSARVAVRTGGRPERWTSQVPLLDNSDPLPSEPDDCPSMLRLDDDALILFTSGTTGQPKGVVHTHRSLQAQWVRLRLALGRDPYSRTLCLLPVFFGHGLICNALFPLVSGCDVFLGPAFSAPLLARLAGLIDEHRITAMSSVPTLWRLALRVSAPPANRTLQRIHCGSAPLSAGLWQQIADWSPGACVVNTYGITETASWIGGSMSASADGLVGQVWGGGARILPPGDLPDLAADCAPGVTGHIWVRTPALMKGYFERSDLTDRVVRNGWFQTGDTGSLTPQGELVLTGRAVDEINKGGLKIQPQDVEIAASACPFVRDVCVFAITDEFYGQNVGIALVLDECPDATVAAVSSWMADRLSPHKMPAAWHKLDALPRTSRGKIQRPAVAALCARPKP